jgi:hypothetical protein
MEGQTLTVRLMYLILLALPLVNISVGNVRKRNPYIHVTLEISGVGTGVNPLTSPTQCVRLPNN